MKHLILIFFTLSSINAGAQECDCSQSFDWMVKTFEKNDAGFQYVIDKKGELDYQKHTALLKDKALSVRNIKVCQELLATWLRYFRSGHIGIYIKPATEHGKEPDAEDIRTLYKDTRVVDLSEKELIKMLKKKSDRQPVEGVWANSNYTIGIVANETRVGTFDCFILKGDRSYWTAGQVKAELVTNNDGSFTADYYMRDHSKEVTTAALADSSGLLFSMMGLWIRQYPPAQLSRKQQLLVAFAESSVPFVERLSDKTIYLRIPSFDLGQKKVIDSVLAAYNSLLTSSANLIIDIRNGTGGGDAAYQGILPYLYTNPVRSVTVQLYGTELNALAFEKYAKLYDDTSDINYCNGVAKKMRENDGKFFSLAETPYRVSDTQVVLPYPKSVAIICNHNNGSTDEQFLLAAKQSRKVKVFGKPTGGMLDISNMNTIESPDNKFVLGYCMSKSFRIPDFCIDGVGIQPDYFMDDGINETDWIEYVQNILEQ